jgi:hypothetical protein
LKDLLKHLGMERRRLSFIQDRYIAFFIDNSQKMDLSTNDWQSTWQEKPSGVLRTGKT